MGLSRRMQKQGPPEPLDESAFATKRKAAHESRGSGRPKKQKQAHPKPVNGAKTNGRSRGASATRANARQTSKGTNRVPVGTRANGQQKQAATKPEPGPASQGSDDDSFDMGGDEDLGPGSVGSSEAGSAIDDFLGSDADLDPNEDAAAGPLDETLWSEDDDDGDEDGEDKLTAANMEAMSHRLDRRKQADDDAAQAELEEAGLQTNIVGDGPGQSLALDDADFELGDDGDEIATVPKLAQQDLGMIRSRISETVRVMEDFSQLAEPGRSRFEYRRRLLRDICAYYGYSAFLGEKLLNLFPPREAVAFFEANETPRPVVIRTNTLRTHRRELAQALTGRGVSCEPVGSWSKIGLQIFESRVPIGATPEYLAGHYILQAAASFLPVMALAPQEHERVLDMAAAPGGKTSHMAACMRNTGCIFANDANRTRAKALVANVHRLGVRNTVVCSYDAIEAFPRIIGGFDRVLLDAPCTGTGVIAKDPSVKTNRVPADFQRLPHRQRRLLLAAIDSVDHASSTGGVIVYSTCSVTIEENEQVVEYALRKRPNVRLISTELPFGKEGFTSYMGKKFHSSLSECRRYYPHAYNIDGFFVAKFKKTGPAPPPPQGSLPASDTADGKTGANGRNGVGHQLDSADESEAGTSRQAMRSGDSAEQLQLEHGSFGSWDDEEDDRLIERGRRAAARRRGIDPRVLQAKQHGK